MIKYLNNRGDKSRNNRQQNKSSQAQGAEPNQGRDQGNNKQENKNNQQDEPGSTFTSNMGNMLKKLVTYQPTEQDDNFSLGYRRVTGSLNPGYPEQNKNQEGTGQGNRDKGSKGKGTQQEGSKGQGNQSQASQGNQSQGNQSQGNQSQGNQDNEKQGQDDQANGNTNQGKQTQGKQTQGKQAQGANNNDYKLQPPPGSAAFYQEQQGSRQEDNVKHTQQGGTPPGEKAVPIDQQVHFELDKNLEHVKRVFDIPQNKGFTIREFKVGFSEPVRAFALFTEGLSDKNIINGYILEPLMVLSGIQEKCPEEPIEFAKQRLVSANQVEEKRNFIEIEEGVLAGSTALFIEGSNQALLVETKGWEHRGIGKPLVENVVRGPQEGFNELLISNIALVRSRLRTPDLVSEMVKVGNLSKADVAVMYLKNVANPAIVHEVHRRLNSLQQVDYIPDTGILEQFIEDSPFSPMPQMLSTERPDRVAGYLSEGHVAILMSSTPFALIVPVTFWALLHSAEDTYVRWPYGGLMRIIRVICLIIALLLPAFYIAIVNFHHSMIPPDLLYAIAASREKVPFPAISEVLIMEVSFELIREAGIRIPSVIGSTIGIVGALILGQAAVQANLISPLVIIIVALTGLGSFAIPNYNLSFQIRILRFIYILFAAIGGFYAIATLMVIHMAILSTTRSFGIPVLTPATPNRPSKDTVLRMPMWAQEERPMFVRPLVGRRQPPVSRSWSPKSWLNRGNQND